MGYIYPTPIQKFYSGLNVFITGATGFLGKVLIEKLIRSCPDLGTLYLLVRSKKGKDPQHRLDDLFDDVVFDRLKSELPTFRQKIFGIVGDCGLPGLGINENDRRLLCSEVSVVFHVAATVNFNEKLKLAIEINVRGIMEMLKMCSNMRQLKSIVHVSTAYSNCTQDTIEEVYYPVPIEGRNAILAAENLSEGDLDALTLRLLEKFPNTYSLTKAIAEDVIRDDMGTLPIGVFRPAIVISTYKEPVPGWIGNMYGPTGITSGALAGAIRIMHCDPKVNANLVPVDMCVNSLIAIAWEVDHLYQKSKREVTAYDAPIYNFESCTEQPINWESFMEKCEQYGINYPIANPLWYYSYFMTPSRKQYLLWLLLLHFIPAFLMDGALFCIGKKPRFFKLYKKIHKLSSALSFFCTRNFNFTSTGMKSLISKMSPQDQIVFFCNLQQLDWEEYFKTYMKGIRLYLLKEPLSTLDKARKKWKMLYWLHQGFKLLLSFVAFGISWFIAMKIVSRR